LQRFSIWPLFINGKIIMERKTEWENKHKLHF
jgi:hypothetical protein